MGAEGCEICSEKYVHEIELPGEKNVTLVLCCKCFDAAYLALLELRKNTAGSQCMVCDGSADHAVTFSPLEKRKEPSFTIQLCCNCLKDATRFLLGEAKRPIEDDCLTCGAQATHEVSCPVFNRPNHQFSFRFCCKCASEAKDAFMRVAWTEPEHNQSPN
jgi:hypothetical protein